MATRWYRAYDGTVTDSKLAEAALIAATSRSVAIAAWHAVLESCACTNDRGRFETTPRRVAAALCEPVAAIEALFAGFVEVGMVNDGRVTSWSKRQFESDNSTERSRKHRSASRNGDATLQQQDAAPPDTDTETETETEKKETPNGVSKENPKRGTRLPEDWRALGEDFAFARDALGSPRAAGEEADRFIDYWRSVPGAKGLKLDWSATWRNWVRKAASDQRGSRNGKPDRPTAHGKLIAGMAAALAQRAAADNRGRVEIDLPATRIDAEPIPAERLGIAGSGDEIAPTEGGGRRPPEGSSASAVVVGISGAEPERGRGNGALQPIPPGLIGFRSMAG